MAKKTAHIILFFFDLLSIALLWVGYNDVVRILSEITNQADSIRFINRIGFFIFGAAVPVFHLYSASEYFWPLFCRKLEPVINKGIFVMIIALFAGSFIGSSWVRSRVESAGYMYCREASGLSALSRSLVYTKTMGVCEKLVDAKYNISSIADN